MAINGEKVVSLSFRCSKCKSEVVVRHLQIGEEAKCRHCGQLNIVPRDAKQTDKKPEYLEEVNKGTTVRKVTSKKEKISIQQAESKPYPGFLQAVWLVVLQKLIMFLIYIPILIAGITTDGNSILRVIIPACAVSVVLWYGQKKANTSFKESFPLSPIKLYFLFPIVVVLIGRIIISAEISSLVDLIIPGGESHALDMNEFFNKSPSAIIIAGMIIAPFIEELLFRGLILRAFLNRYSITKSVLFSALLFGVYHNIYSFIPAFLFGIFSGWLFIKTR